MDLKRLNKYIQEKGIASRRKADELIAGGFVKVNGKVVTEMGVKVDASKDTVEVNKSHLEKIKKKTVYLKMNKPIGLECAVKEHARGTIYELLRKFPKGVVSVGRLDKMSEGLLICTNDGRLTYKLTHPKFEKEKEYEVTTAHPIRPVDILNLSRGVEIQGYKTKPAEVVKVSSRKFRITLREGRNRQIRRMCRNLGIKIHKLKRVRVGEIDISDLEIGEVKYLNPLELQYIEKVLKEN